MSSETDDPEATANVRRIMSVFIAGLAPGPGLVFERIVQSLAQAAEQLPADATPEEIRDRARLIRRRRL